MFTARVTAHARRVWFGLALFIPGTAALAAPPPDFTKDVKPIFEGRCLKCHGAGKLKGGLDLRSKSAVLKGSDTGPVVVPGSAAKSRLFEVVSHGDMPPKPEPGLNEAQTALLKSWIDAGAPGTDTGTVAPAVASPALRITDQHRAHWAFRPLGDPAVPGVRNQARARNAVDAFLLARLEPVGLAFSTDADRVTLARRAALDLLGLPPTCEEVDAFVNDSRADAFERYLDQLLASPHFGERWGRHWLDEAGYVDVLGTDNDAAIISFGENKWRYRDYVVHALNEDKPFDRFLTEQIAGDELADWRSSPTFTPDVAERLVATGYLRNAADDTDANELNRLDVHHAILQRTGEMMAGSLFALTLGCAKCHDHKYEPLPQADYYRLMAVLQPAFNPDSWLQPKQRQLPEISPTEKALAERHNAELDRKVEELRGRVSAIRAPHETRLRSEKLARLPEPIRADTRTAVDTPAAKRTEIQKYLAEKLEASLKVRPEEVAAALGADEKNRIGEVERQIGELNKQRRSWGHLQVVYDAGVPTPTRMLKRGEPLNPGQEVGPGIPTVLSISDASSSLAAEKVAAKTSGRRLALARRLTDSRSPAGALVLRVRVNRVWQHLFGQGIVETEDNLGVTGARPTHPELLEWMARTFDANGQKLKPFLKLLMTSTAYRQASARPNQPAPCGPGGPDPDNKLLWRQRLRRLEAEAVRDSVLAVSGQLDRRAGGPPVQVQPKPDGTYEIADAVSGGSRRTIYLLARRNYHPTVLAVFDQPNLTANCTHRTASAVVLQSLTMLNDRFILEQAAQTAKRVVAAGASADPEDLVERAFRLVLGRSPRQEEVGWSVALLHRQADRHRASATAADPAELKALAHLCQVLLNTSEFLYTP